ncbi:RWD-domain-containing protein [Laetiporus sulphureus 93-53]|uniref:RWD-domain-containing protein n=1 Tax=Laetiporus sulphureus 93-53 TaxID=1314785 RepID=A0A165H8N5_9APHY|nr:RWD-domain-containing protein [Laetiporus sulphureus 93-53]KZT11396.1 RWD-domain-containing protein [Laetiporus sulphureus 93-53]
MSDEVLAEEFEVLESIYPTELTKLSERSVRIDIEPEEPNESEDELKLALEVQYTEGYPDVLPELSLEAVEGSIEDGEVDDLLDDLRRVGEENLGMAMTFALVTHLRDELSALIKLRAEHRKQDETEKERQAIEAEEVRTRGTPITVESFKAWKAEFDKELAIKKAREEEEKLKGMAPKEREEYKRLATRLTGRQLFERDRNLAISDENLDEEGVVSVDISQYDRTTVQEEEEESQVPFSDSD